jgi:desulfoferrodoxin (superoxide reductase-like protein)
LVCDLGERFNFRYKCVIGGGEEEFINGGIDINTGSWRQMRHIPSIDYSQFKENDVVEIEIKNAVRVGYFNKTDSKYLYLKPEKNNVNSKVFPLTEIRKITKIK